MGPIGCPETSVGNYHCMLRNISEEQRSHLLQGRKLKSHMVYYAHFPSIMKLMFRGNSSHSVNIFKIQKNLIRIITGCKSTDSSNSVLRIQSQYISLFFLVVPNKNKINLNCGDYNTNTTQKCNFHQPS
jgi:hypothetical protein